MTDVVFWLPAINPYWHERFKALERDGRVDFVCWFNRRIDPMRSWIVDESDMSYPHRFFAGPRLQTARNLIREYRAADPERIFTFHFDPGLWPAWLHKLRGRHVALYCLMTWDSWVTRSRVKEVAKRIFFTASSSTLTPGPDSDAWALRYGARKLFRLHHAVDVSGLREAAGERDDSSSLRLLYIGRLIPEKGISFLQDVLHDVLVERPDCLVTIVGDGPMYQELQEWASRYDGRVIVRPFVQARDIGAVYAGSDVLLFPTTGDPYGLVVDEALAAGMPVISSDRAGDISWRLADSRGWVLPHNDAPLWQDTVRLLLRDRSLVQGASHAALSYSQGHDVSRWVDELVHWRDATYGRRSFRHRTRSV